MSDTVKVTMPRLGESIVEGTLVRWLVRPGAKVTAFDVIAEIDTDKVSAEIPTPVTGIVVELLASEGDAVKVGAEIAVIEPVQTTSTEATRRLSRSAAPTSELVASTDERDERGASDRHRYSPAVRELARANDVDLSTVPGTGAEGRVTRTDVMRMIEDRTRTRNDPPRTRITSVSTEADEVVPLSRMRRLIADNMTLSKTTIPHAWQSQEVDMSGVVANRNANKELFEREEGFSLTFLPYVVAAAALALRRHPFANATFRPDGIALHKAINIGIAIGLDEGVIVPVIREADALSVRDLGRAINDLSARARTKRLRPDDLSGATFTVNNSGTFGTVLSYSVISPGQAGILTMGAIKERVIAVDGRMGIKPMMFLSFSLDHRILDGLGGAQFLSTCRHALESTVVDTRLS
jgi:2-oxoisovalerate dehydrogenase E2 component (dihydrolipoyl transacylase)